MTASPTAEKTLPFGDGLVSVDGEDLDGKPFSRYLDRCQVDTPHSLVKLTWDEVLKRRTEIGLVLDFGSGDCRFARHGRYDRYIGYEIDPTRQSKIPLPTDAEIEIGCAFASNRSDADLCIGNPPFVRNQDLPDGWRNRMASLLREKTGIQLSGYANAWQYFMLLAIASCREDGLCALVVPYEWISRPSVKTLRDYIRSMGWTVAVTRLEDQMFNGVLTTASVTIIDKRGKSGLWSVSGCSENEKPTESMPEVLAYTKREYNHVGPRATRGLSPGHQRALVLTETERLSANLDVNKDVVPAVTTLRTLPRQCRNLTPTIFRENFIEAGLRCWLIRTDIQPSTSLETYLNSVDSAYRNTVTCQAREIWWKFAFPQTPQVLSSQSFRAPAPKTVLNSVGAKAVGGTCAVHGLTQKQARFLVNYIGDMNLEDRIVAHSNGLLKVEINQFNTLMDEVLSTFPSRSA